MPEQGERLLGTVDIRVEVFVGVDDGTHYRPPEAYLAIRVAKALASNLGTDAAEEAAALVEWAAEDIDADSLLVEAVKEALTIRQEPTVPSAKES